MGMTEVRVRVANLEDRKRFADVDMVVDSGAIYSIVPASVLRSIGVEPRETQAFGLANASRVRRQVGDVRYEIGDRSGAAPVIFGRRGDAPLLGGRIRCDRGQPPVLRDRAQPLLLKIRISLPLGGRLPRTTLPAPTGHARDAAPARTFQI